MYHSMLIKYPIATTIATAFVVSIVSVGYIGLIVLLVTS